MNQGTKQRVVGTVVLLALALIFLPILFDGDGSYSVPIESRIPEQPIVSIMPEPMQTRPVIQSDRIEESEPEVEPDEQVTSVVEPTVDAAAADSDETTTAIAATARELDAAGLPVAWSVRLGMFSNAENASNLTRRLMDAGYRAYTRETISDQAVMTAVYVGPRLDRDDADRLKQELQQEFELAGMVVRYEVDSI